MAIPACIHSSHGECHIDGAYTTARNDVFDYSRVHTFLLAFFFRKVNSSRKRLSEATQQ